MEWFCGHDVRMIRIRHQQPSLWEGLFAEELAELWEPWMRVVDELLEDDALVDAVYEAQGERHEQSRRLGRPQTPAEGELRRQREYRQLLRLTRQILGDTGRVLQEVAGLPRRRRSGARELCERLETMAERVRRVVRQTKARVFQGVTQWPGKLVSLFEPHTEIIRKGKAGKPNEFGKLVQVQEAENQIVTHYEVLEERPSDSPLLQSAVEVQRRKLGRVPQTGKATLVQAGQKWRTGCEGRISVLKRRHGLARSRYHGSDGMRRWVGLGIIADNLINMGRWLALPQPA